MSEAALSDQIIKTILQHVGDEILIGGQAVAYWANYYQLDFIGTKDIDFLGDAQAAKALADHLQAQLSIPRWDDHTPNTAAVMISTGQNQKEIIEVDYLGSVIGLDEKQIVKRAVEMQYGDSVLHVMHPLDCLDSRIANLSLLTDKQTKAGVQQADTAIQIVRRHLEAENAIKPDEERYRLNMVERLIDIARSHNGKRVYARWDLDALNAIPLDVMPEKFLSERWPRIQAEVADKRQRYRKLYKQAKSPDDHGCSR